MYIVNNKVAISLQYCTTNLHCYCLHVQGTDFLMTGFMKECVFWLSKQIRLKHACSVTDAKSRQEMSGIEIRCYTILTANDYCANKLKP